MWIVPEALSLGLDWLPIGSIRTTWIPKQKPVFTQPLLTLARP